MFAIIYKGDSTKGIWHKRNPALNLKCPEFQAKIHINAKTINIALHLKLVLWSCIIIIIVWSYLRREIYSLHGALAESTLCQRLISILHFWGFTLIVKDLSNYWFPWLPAAQCILTRNLGLYSIGFCVSKINRKGYADIALSSSATLVSCVCGLRRTAKCNVQSFFVAISDQIAWLSGLATIGL